MKIINPSVSLIKETDPFKKIEICGRLCYKSEPKGEPEKFFAGLAKRNHFAMLEHATFVFEVSKHIYYHARTNKYLSTTRTRMSDGTYRHLVSGNLRALNESIFAPILVELRKTNPALAYTGFNFADTYKYLIAYECDGVDMFIEEVDLLCLKELTEEEFNAHAYFSFHFICDRGVTHEIVRHRPASYAQESTRYCNYGKQDEITVILPSLFADNVYRPDGKPWEAGEYERKYELWRCSQLVSEDTYLTMIKEKCTPQEARSVLTNSLKTEIIMTASAGEFEHFFNLRSRGTTGAPHPDMKVVADMALTLFEAEKSKYDII